VSFSGPRSRVPVLFALLVLAPVAAALIIAILLLLGVSPHLVFLPGHELRSVLESCGVHVHNRVGVLMTVLFWWAVLVVVALLLGRWRRRPGA
jgi:predicted cobalt transporter CbtA